MSIVSYYDLFPLGLGLDLAGGALLASGLYTRPADLARSMRQSRGSFARFNVRAAQDRGDVIGVRVLVAGFAAQGVGYVLYIGGVSSKTHGSGAWLVALALLVLGLAVGFFYGRATRSREVRRYLIEVARYDEFSEEPHEHPLAGELQRYATLLGEHHGLEDYMGEQLTGEAERFWGQQEVRRWPNAD